MKYRPKAEIRDGKKQCRLCLKWISVDKFGTFVERRKGRKEARYLNSRCRQCCVKVSRQWAVDNADRLKARQAREKKEQLRQIREAYGNKCNCCGETEPMFLTIDHINNDGYKLRPRNKNGNYQAPFSGVYYRQIIKAGFPDDLQLLCWNCNCGRHRNGGICPHKEQK